MRLSQCKQSIMVKFMVEEHDGWTVKLMARKGVLMTILGDDLNSLGEGEITKKLPMLESLNLKYNVQAQIVSEMQFQQNFN